MKRLAEIALRLQEIETEYRKGDLKAERMQELIKEVDDLQKEKEAIEARNADFEARFKKATPVDLPKGEKEDRDVETPFETKEYRKAFRKYFSTGVMSEVLEQRADAITATTDIGAIIPTTILNKIVDVLKDSGEIWAKVTKTNYPGGVDIPTSSAKPTASWVAEGSVAAKQKKAVGKISFSYYKLQIRVSMTLVANSVSLDVFESTVAENIAEAMIVALETAILNGTGTGQPTGITVDSSIPSAQVVTFATTDATYNGWLTKLFNNIPTAYLKKKNGLLIMNKATFFTYILGLVDDNKQPVARVTYGLDGAPKYMFMGKEVLIRDEVAALNASTAASTVVCIYVDLSDYLVNTNLEIGTRKYFDEDLDQWVQKSTMIADGRLADPNGVVLLKTASA